ncbi:ChaN family lipoprotein [Marinobacter antarcticus]|nr:ChaN family lipoprotein [Marinobacter antarcticus]
MKKLLVSVLVVLIIELTGCAVMMPPNSAAPKPQTLYETLLIDSSDDTVLTVETLAERLASTDVVVIGEYHGHQASHLLQSQIQAALYRWQPRQLLSMEQFNLDHQAAVDAYLSGATGETEMIEDSKAWDNYRASYRPLVEFARQHTLPVIAANAPASIVRCVGRTGPDYLSKLPAGERAQLPEHPFMDTPAYREKFNAAITSSHAEANETMRQRLDNTYKAQLLRDNTMASQILAARVAYPHHQIIHTTGTFHSEERLGTVALLKRRAPDVSVVVISPVVWPQNSDKAPLQDNRIKGNFIYFVQPLPDEFVDEAREHKAMLARFRQPIKDTCQGDTP